jgi:hypothetical protein
MKKLLIALAAIGLQYSASAQNLVFQNEPVFENENTSYPFYPKSVAFNIINTDDETTPPTYVYINFMSSNRDINPVAQTILPLSSLPKYKPTVTQQVGGGRTITLANLTLAKFNVNLQNVAYKKGYNKANLQYVEIIIDPKNMVKESGDGEKGNRKIKLFGVFTDNPTIGD